jgi:hypothetical protein
MVLYLLPLLLLTPRGLPERLHPDLKQAVRQELSVRSRRRQPTPHAVARWVLAAPDRDLFMSRLIHLERNFFRPGVAFDGKTGMTFDAHFTNARTGRLVGHPRAWSAASKESLHLILLAKAIQGDPTAQLLVGEDLGNPAAAAADAIGVLTRKIKSYEAFHRRYPGFGGFLPWYRIARGGRVEPLDRWEERVPGLDNGQLAWSLYLTAHVLREHGELALAERYRAHLALMEKNVVRVFFDPEAGQMRTEARLALGNQVPVAQNHYQNHVPGRFLDDPFEGVLLCHFADLFGDWSEHPEGKEALWSDARRTRLDRRGLTVQRGDTASSHEDWGYLVLPFRDLETSEPVYHNVQKARARDAVEHGWRGLRAAAHAPPEGDSKALPYINTLGVQELARERLDKRRLFAPYAAFPLALVDRPRFVDWLRSMVARPNMLTPYGALESFSDETGRVAPIMTWDAKALPLIAWMGGVAPDIARLLRAEGHYDAFAGRAREDHRRFLYRPIYGRDQVVAGPPGSRSPGGEPPPSGAQTSAR